MKPQLYVGPAVRMVCSSQGERVPCQSCEKWHPHRREELVSDGQRWPWCATHKRLLEVAS